MVFGLLALAAIPTTIAVAEGVSSKENAGSETAEDPFVTSTTEAQRMRKFRLRCYCSNSPELDGGGIVLRDGRLWILPSSSTPSSSPFLGFYVPYPDPTRKPFPPCGLVSFIPTTNPATPTLNWIYIHDSRALLYGNRTASLPHVAGSWGWTDDEEGGGVTLDGVEGAVAVEMEEGWQLFWEDGNGGIQHGRRRFEVSVERVFIEDLASG